MKRRIRLLPVFIFCATLALTLKLANIWHGVDGVIASSSAAETATADAAAEKDADDGQAADATSDGTPEPAADGAAKTDADGKHGKNDSAKDRPGGWFDPAAVTDAELQVLQNLSERRKQIDDRERELDMREELLRATEQRLDAKIAKMKKIQATIEGLLKKHTAERDKKLKSVVKIYERMKPKDAARIFEKLDMPILLDVVERMREAKAAPIMANMDPKKAKAVTAALARRRALPEPEKSEVR